MLAVAQGGWLRGLHDTLQAFGMEQVSVCLIWVHERVICFGK